MAWHPLLARVEAFPNIVCKTIETGQAALAECKGSSYTSRVLGTYASLYMELAEAVFSKFTELV